MGKQFVFTLSAHGFLFFLDGHMSFLNEHTILLDPPTAGAF